MTHHERRQACFPAARLSGRGAQRSGRTLTQPAKDADDLGLGGLWLLVPVACCGGPPPGQRPSCDRARRQTGSCWSVLGYADAGPLAGQNLTPVTHADTFWFVWAAFRPHTRVIA